MHAATFCMLTRPSLQAAEDKVASLQKPRTVDLLLLIALAPSSRLRLPHQLLLLQICLSAVPLPVCSPFKLANLVTTSHVDPAR